jgi:hypothetical protein
MSNRNIILDYLERALRQAGLNTYYSANISTAEKIAKQPAFQALIQEIRNRPWPGYCQNCWEPLDPPNSTSCHSCGMSDAD